MNVAPIADTNGYFYEEMLISNGSDIISKSSSSLTSATFTAGNAKGKEAMNFYLSLNSKGYIKTNSSGEVDKTDFIQGKTAFVVDYVNRSYAVDGGYASMRDDYAFIRTPRGSGISKNVVGNNWFFGLTVPKGVKNLEVIADIIAAYCEPMLNSIERTQVLTAQLSRAARDKNSQTTLKNLSSYSVSSPIYYFGSSILIGDDGWLSKYLPLIKSGQMTADSAYSAVNKMYSNTIQDILNKK